MKIAYFVGTLKKEKEDGVARVLLSFARMAKEKGIESIIVTGSVQDESECPVPVLEVSSVTFPLYTDYKLTLPRTGGFEKELDEFKPDIIHLHSPDTIAWCALRYAKKRGIPIIATQHTSFMHYAPYYRVDFLVPLIWATLRKIYSKMDIVTAPTSAITDELNEHNINNVETLNWGVNFDSFNPSFRSEEIREKILEGKNGNIILYVGRLTWEKDLKTLAKIYHLLKKSRNDFKMVVAGDGPVREDLELMMPGAMFYGYVGGEELSRLYASSDIFLFPSSTETFGMVTAEAMASGTVPVVANAGGSKVLVENGKTGFLAEPKNAGDFYEKVCTLLDNRGLREQMRNASLKSAENMTWEKAFGKLQQLYRQLIKNN